MSPSLIQVLVIGPSPARPGADGALPPGVWDGPGVRGAHADGLAAAVERLREHRPDIILLDVKEGSEAPELIAALKAQAPQIPVVVLGGDPTEETARRAVWAGAEDYWCKGSLPDPARISRALQTILWRTQSRRETASSPPLPKAFFQYYPAPVFIVDENGAVRFATRSAAALLGRGPEEAVGLEIGVPAAASDGTLLDIIAGDGSQQIHEMRIKPVEWQGRSMRMICLHDVTRRKQAEESGFRAERMLTSTRDLVALVDRSFVHLSANQSYCDVFGGTGASLVGKTMEAVWGEAFFRERLRPSFETCLNGGENHVRDWFRLPDGGRRYLDLGLSPYREEDGVIAGVVLNGRDITGLRRAEESLRRLNETLELQVERRTLELARSNQALKEHVARLKQLNHELEDFSWIASHDLKEPLRKIQTFGSRLERRQGSLDRKDREDIQRMIRSANRMCSLVEALKSYAEITGEKTALAPVDLTAVVREAAGDLDVAIQEAGGRIEIAALPTLEVDRTLMRQLFQNLIDNAIKYAKPEEQPVVRIAGRVEDGMCHIQVTDNGIGFDEQYTTKIFTPFQRLHGKEDPIQGTGMGLAICRKVAQIHGGSITARSAPGEGAVFCVSLPMPPAKGAGP